MLKYDRLFKKFQQNGYTVSRIKQEKIIGQATYYGLKAGTKGLDAKSIDKLCKLFDCQPNDIMEYIPDNAVSPNKW